MKNHLVCVTLLAGALAASAQAEVYRWVDKDGKVHFTDRKPDSSTATEDISEAVSKSNIDDSAEQIQKLGEVFPKETEAEKALREQQTRKRGEQRQKHARNCARARNMLNKLRGPVYFVDKNGKSYNITERERKEREAKLRAQIQQYCG